MWLFKVQILSDWYFSSSEESASYAKAYNFFDAVMGVVDKAASSIHVRAIRSF